MSYDLIMLRIMLTKCVFPAAPEVPDTPTLTSSPSQPIEGDDIVLTCTSTTSGISHYLFTVDGLPLADSPSNTYTITMATGADSGTYTCDVRKDGITSLPSSGHVIQVIGG